MTPARNPVQVHYDTFLARTYLWMAGGGEENTRKCMTFFRQNNLFPRMSGPAVDLGAGCGFQSIPLARLGFRVTAVDFSADMLEYLKERAGNLPVEVVRADILDFSAWAGRQPELIVCMGDTLTHLPDAGSVRSLISRCAQELHSEGRLVISCRNYSREPALTRQVIPVRRDGEHIFLCSLDYTEDRVQVMDILYSHETGSWVRSFGTYSKLRIAPGILEEILTGEGLAVSTDLSCEDRITLICRRPERWAKKTCRMQGRCMH